MPKDIDKAMFYHFVAGVLRTKASDRAKLAVIKEQFKKVEAKK